MVEKRAARGVLIAPLFRTMALIGMIIVSGCGIVPLSDPAKDNPVVTEDERSMQQIMNDASITASITAKYAKAKAIRLRDVTVSTFNGIVQLEGVLPTLAVEDQAILLASEAKGVTKIISKIKIENP
jgi:hyperosmotically inducible protein